MILKIQDKNVGVVRLNQWLRFLAPTEEETDAADNIPQDLFTPRTQTLLKEYQAKKGLTPDGVFGAKTFAEMRKDVQNKHMELGGFKLFSKVACPANAYKGGYDSFRLRTDAAYWYNGFHANATAMGAVVTSSGSDRSLDAKVSAARSPTSMHYIATAFDLYVYSAMMNPETDPYVVERDGDYWRVWARAHHGLEMTIQNPVTYKHRKGTGKPVKGRFIDLTALAKLFNYTRIKPRASFFQGGSEMGAEWWHFQNEFVLFPNFSKFGEELLTLHSPANISKSALRNYADKTFAVDWF